MAGVLPIPMRWSGEAMEPRAGYERRCDQQFVIGQTYAMAVVEDRSSASHNHYFAALHQAWLNLPPEAAERFRSVEHLRKYALIKAGFHDERSIACPSKAAAQAMATFIEPLDDYAIVTATEAVVTVYTAKSQAMRAMGKAVFEASKEAVLNVVSEMIGVDAATLSAAA